jgi:hypothetical protein
MNHEATGKAQDWVCHGWDDHISGQLEHARSLSFRQRLEWLEEMSALVARFAKNPDWAGRHELRERDSWILNDPPSSGDR